MNKKIFIILLLFAMNIINAKNISILFIGNSYTYMNNFSQMLTDIGTELKDTIYVEVSAFDSYTLEKHFSTKETIDKINSYCWDYVVLQEQSQRPVLDMDSFNEKTFFYAEKFLQIIYNNNTDTRPVLFMTWGRKYGDKDNCKKHFYTCTYEEMQNKLIERYNLLSSMLGIDVVPCGLAWKYFTLENANYINLFYEDNSHPNDIGTYLNALCFYSAITGKSPEGVTCPIENISNTEILSLQKISYEINKNNKNINTD